jgi:CDP-glycerol glycerophosphotransferase (TagB/SpsB family)
MIKILFETHHLYYLPNFEPIINQLKKRDNYDIYISMPQYINDREKNLFHSACELLKINIISEQDETLRIEKIISIKLDVIVVGNIGQLNKIVSDLTITVMVYHGIGLKQSYYKDTDDRINIRAVESESRLNKLKEQGQKNIVLTGFTKIDPLYLSDDKADQQLKNKLGINNNRPIILYAPTFYPTSFENIYQELEFISAEYNIIIKLHNFSWFQSRYIHQSNLATKMASNNENIYLLDSSVFDIIPYYKISDVLISDISSTIFEFLPLNRPIIQAECLKLRLRHIIFNKRFKKKLDLDRMQELDFVYKVESPSELYRCIVFSLDHPEEMSELRKDAHNYYLHKEDGKASLRLVEEIEKGLC